MELTTLLFLGFFAAVALLNYTLPRVLRHYCLLAASYLFYCWGANDRLLVPVLVAATLVTWGCGLVIGKCRIGPVRVIFLLLAVFTCVGLLFYYKYWNLLAADILSGRYCSPARIWLPRLAWATLPLLRSATPLMYTSAAARLS